MKSLVKDFIIILNFIRCIPHIALFYLHSNKSTIHADVVRWLKILEKNYSVGVGFVYLLAFYPEYRNLFYYRIGYVRHLIKILCPGSSTLFINTPVIGEGLFIQHGFSTIINASSIGKNCWINQQVTIGFTNKNDSPVLLDNVTVYAGAKVIGNVKLGNNSVVGANAVVVKDVPDDCTVVGIPARIVKQNGAKINSNTDCR